MPSGDHRWLWLMTEYLRRHELSYGIYKGFLKVIVLIPEKEIIAMFFMKTKSVEYL